MKAMIWMTLLLGLTAGAQELPRVGVFDFQANGASKELASATAGVVANELQRLELFRVSTSDAMRDLVVLERQKQILGCPDDSCVSGLAGSLAVDYVVSGKVSRIPGMKDMPTAYSLELALLNVKKGSRESSDIQTTSSESELMARVPRAVHKLVAKILKGRSGSLFLTVSEAGATVKIDETVIGTSPLSGHATLTAGPHLLVVEKKGFVAAQKEIRINPDQLREETVSLAPSPDFIKDYDASASRMRLGAWISSGVAAVGVGAAVFLQVRATRLYGAPDVFGSFAYHRSRLLAGIEVEDGVDHRQAANSLKSQIDSAQLLSYVGLGVAGLAAAGAAYFWIAGDEPGRYAKFKGIDAKVGLVPLPGGALGSVALVF